MLGYEVEIHLMVWSSRTYRPWIPFGGDYWDICIIWSAVWSTMPHTHRDSWRDHSPFVHGGAEAPNAGSRFSLIRRFNPSGCGPAQGWRNTVRKHCCSILHSKHDPPNMPHWCFAPWWSWTVLPLAQMNIMISVAEAAWQDLACGKAEGLVPDHGNWEIA